MAKRKKKSEVDAEAPQAANPGSDVAVKEITPTVARVEREDDTGATREVYRILEVLLEERHKELIDANIAVAWRYSKVAEDSDGRLVFGRVHRGNDLWREFSDVDFVLVVTHQVWEKAAGVAQKRAAILDWLLCQCAPVMDNKAHEQKSDTKGRLLWRTRRPTGVFAENLAAFGAWQELQIAANLETFRQKHLPGMDPVSQPAA